jgi:hypothetical protein
MDENIIECSTVYEANQIDWDKYRLSERLSKTFGKYVFVKRQRPR